jgi:hypothetical protein
LETGLEPQDRIHALVAPHAITDYCPHHDSHACSHRIAVAQGVAYYPADGTTGHNGQGRVVTMAMMRRDHDHFVAEFTVMFVSAIRMVAVIPTRMVTAMFTVEMPQLSMVVSRHVTASITVSMGLLVSAIVMPSIVAPSIAVLTIEVTVFAICHGHWGDDQAGSSQQQAGESKTCLHQSSPFLLSFKETLVGSS